ncbi:hypothetical protein ACKU27_12150 [Sphingobium yanoikuyae]|uniref:hypothetical protein n=1 Tax=Sphingobium yanoikuyae TaxID=13690 RepID=UPI003B8EFF95
MIDYANIALTRLIRLRRLMAEPVIEADRSAYQSDPGDECPCPICTSDCARIVPCQREND